MQQQRWGNDMAKQPPKKPPKKRKHLGKAGTKSKPGDKVVVMKGAENLDGAAIAAANAAATMGVNSQFPTIIDLKKKVSEGLVASNYSVYDWAANQFLRMTRLMETMDIIEEVAFTREEILKLTAIQRIKLWKTLEQAGATRIELMQVINSKAHEFHLVERFLQGAEQETDLATGIPKELPYSLEFRQRVREEYARRVMGITPDPTVKQ
jgi:hypothetical protein